jgi:uncharacterized protein DUF4054
MTNPIVTFDYGAFIARYPEFSQTSAVQAQGWFDEATTFHHNDGTGPVADAATQLRLLNMLTAHVGRMEQMAQLFAPAGTAGRVASVTEGSVSISFAPLAGEPFSATWFTQTIYGFAYWQATSSYRAMHYRVNRARRVFDPPPFGNFVP